MAKLYAFPRLINYAQMPAKEIHKRIRYYNSNLYYARKFEWLPGMVEVWQDLKVQCEMELARRN